MKSQKDIASVLVVMLALAMAIAATATEGMAQGQGIPIWLKTDRFTPGAGAMPAIPPGLFIGAYAQNQRGYYIVQFSGPVKQSWKDELRATGAEILDYIPDFAFKVRMNPAQAGRAGNLSGVNWVGIFQPAYKLSPDLIRSGMQAYSVHIERGSDFGLSTAAVAATGAQILSRDGAMLTVAATSEQVDAIARILDVAWVENFTVFQKHNDYAGGVILGSNIANQKYDGSSQIIGIADTGLGGGTAATAHADIETGRVVGIFNWPGSASACFETIQNDGAVDVDSGHGTHTTVSALGAGILGRGTAPGAGLVFQAVENYVTISFLCQFLYGYQNGYYLPGIPADLNQLYQQAYDAGARIHSDSWGAAVAGAYDANSANTDNFVWSHPDMTITFSAGNNGVDANSDGIIDNDSIGSPGTAKNVITVGASENDRQDGYPCDPNLDYVSCNGSNEDIIATYGSGFGFPADPIKSDLSVGNIEQMAAFSSRGPTDDGRIKPDVVAPGTYVLSGYSDMYQQHYDSQPNPQNGQFQYDGWGYPESEYLKYMGGTSMSNPLVAGGAALVRDYYQKEHAVSASAALVKATIINSAVDMLDENNDGVNDNDYPIPNSSEGWGRADLAAATSGAMEFDDNSAGLSTGASNTYEVTTSGGSLKVTLVWSDYPGSTSASVNLVNDLDLIVTGAETYYGNVFSGGWSSSGGNRDRRNNVENVYIENPGSGTVYTIEINGYNIPDGPQPYALVVAGASFGNSGSNRPPVAVASADPNSGQAPLMVQFTGSGSSDPDGGALTYSWNFGDGSSSAVADPSHTYDNPGGYTVTLTVTDDHGAADTASLQVTVSPDNGNIIHVEDISIEVIQGKKDYALASVTIRYFESGSPVEGALVTGDWSGVVNGTSTASTGTDGIAMLQSPKTPRSGTFTFTVTGVTADGLVYDASKNVETSDSSDSGSPPPLAEGVHVGNLAGYSGGNGTIWVADVSITIHDQDENLVVGATVHGTWSGGITGTDTCITSQVVDSIFCTVITDPISVKRKSVSFTVTDVVYGNYVYQSDLNHDVEGDTDGTRIVINRP